MLETQQTHITDPADTGGETDAMVAATTDSDTGSADANQQAELSFIERTTGRKFSSLGEAEKYLRNLNNLVGDGRIAEQRKKAELADYVVTQFANEKGISLDEARKELETLVVPSRKPGTVSHAPSTVQSDPRVDMLERELFLSRTPEAAPYMERIDRYAKAQNMPISEAYKELYGDVLAEKTRQVQSEAKRTEKKMASVTTSSSAPSAPSIPRSKELLELARKTGDQSYLIEAMKARSREAQVREEE